MPGERLAEQLYQNEEETPKIVSAGKFFFKVGRETCIVNSSPKLTNFSGLVWSIV